MKVVHHFDCAKRVHQIAKEVSFKKKHNKKPPTKAHLTRDTISFSMHLVANTEIHFLAILLVILIINNGRTTTF
jgi:hypothetical protein